VNTSGPCLNRSMIRFSTSRTLLGNHVCPAVASVVNACEAGMQRGGITYSRPPGVLPRMSVFRNPLRLNGGN
jgi:hypothetical protein